MARGPACLSGSRSVRRTIKFLGPLGRNPAGRSYAVEYYGEYDHDRPPHVELHDQTNVDRRKPRQLPPARGTVFELGGPVHRPRGRLKAFYVKDLYKDSGAMAHFTVHFGDRPMSDFMGPLTNKLACARPDGRDNHGARWRDHLETEDQAPVNYSYDSIVNEMSARPSRAEAAELVHLDLSAEYERRQRERCRLELARRVAIWERRQFEERLIGEYERDAAKAPDGDAGLSPVSELSSAAHDDTANSSSSESDVTVLPSQDGACTLVDRRATGGPPEKIVDFTVMISSKIFGW